LISVEISLKSRYKLFNKEKNMVKITKELGVGKDGYQTGGVEYKEEVGKVAVDPRSKIITNQDDPMNKINEGNTVDVRGRRRMLADKKKTATWY
jgi:hypothetical protein